MLRVFSLCVFLRAAYGRSLVIIRYHKLKAILAGHFALEVGNNECSEFKWRWHL